MSSEADETTEGIRRALDAAEAANEAAQDIATLSAAHKAFAEAVMKGQRRNTMFAAGAGAGAMVAIALGGLVYFRSVADLRVAAAVQSEAATLLVEELQQFDHIGDSVTEQQERMKAELLELLEKVKDEIRRAAMEGDAPPAEEAAVDPALAETIRAGVKEDIGAARDEIMQALAEISLATRTGGGGPELQAALEELKAAAARLSGDRPAAGGTGAGGTATGGTAEPAAKPRPKPKPAAQPQPSPFAYP